MSLETTESRIVSDAALLPLVACPCLAFQTDPTARTCDFCGGITSPHSKDCEPCGGTGEVPGGMAKSIEMALTVPYEYDPQTAFLHDGTVLRHRAGD